MSRNIKALISFLLILVMIAPVSHAIRTNNMESYETGSAIPNIGFYGPMDGLYTLPASFGVSEEKSYTGDKSYHILATTSATALYIPLRSTTGTVSFAIWLNETVKNSRLLIYGRESHVGTVATTITANRVAANTGWETYNGTAWISLGDTTTGWNTISFSNHDVVAGTFTLTLNGVTNTTMEMRDVVTEITELAIHWSSSSGYTSQEKNLWIDDISLVPDYYAKREADTWLEDGINGWYSRSSYHYNGTVYETFYTRTANLVITTIDDDTGDKSNYYHILRAAYTVDGTANDHAQASVNILKTGPYAGHVVVSASTHGGECWYWRSKTAESITDGFDAVRINDADNTYSFLVENPDGTLLNFARNDVESVYYTSFDYGDTWGAKTILLTTATRTPYMMVFQDVNTDYIHIGINSYHGAVIAWKDLHHIYSDDYGVSWRMTNGTLLVTPIDYFSNLTNIEPLTHTRIYDITTDSAGTPHILGLTNSTSLLSNLTSYRYISASNTWEKTTVGQTCRLGIYSNVGGYQTGGNYKWMEPTKVYIAANVDPSDSNKSELFLYSFSSGVWVETEQITNYNSQIARPIVPTNADNIQVFFSAVYNYDNFRTQWNSSVHYLFVPTPPTPPTETELLFIEISDTLLNLYPIVVFVGIVFVLITRFMLPKKWN